MRKKLFTLLTLLLAVCSGAWAVSGTITAASTTDLGNGNTPRHVVEETGVGRLMKNDTGSSAWTASGTGTLYLTTGSSKFALQTYNAISSIVVHGYGTGNNRTFSSLKVGTTTSNYADATASGTGTMSSTASDQTITITPSSTIAANSYVSITLSGNVNIYSVELVYASVTYTITLDKNGGTADGSATATEGSNTLTSITRPSYAGYSVVGYYKEAGLTNLIANKSGELQASTDYTDESGNWTATENKTLYTKWEVATTYSVTYNANGADSGSVPSDDTDYDDEATVTVLDNTGSLVKDGYVFSGWNTVADGSGTTYAAGATFTISANTTLYAVWTAYDYLFTPTKTSGSISDGAEVETSTGGTLVASLSGEKATMQYATDGLQFGGASTCYAIVTITGKSMVPGTVITATLKNPDANKARGLKLNNSAGTTKATWTATSTDVYTKTYTVVAGDGLAGTNTFTLQRNENTYLQSLVVSGCLAPSDLAQVNGDKLAVEGESSTTYTFTEGVDYTTSSDGAITLTSSNTSVATVDGMTLNFVDDALGLTTVTLTQAATSSYAGSSLTYYVIATGSHNTATSTLDFSNASATKTMLTGNWNGTTYDLPYYGNDGENYYMVFSPVAAYGSYTNQTWVNNVTGTSSAYEWDATGVFQGYTTYPRLTNSLTGSNIGKSKAATINANRNASGDDRRAKTWYAYQVKGINKAQILADARGSNYQMALAAYEIDGSVAASTTNLAYATGSGNNVISLEGLDEAKTYLVTISYNNTSNAPVYEVAFFFPTDLSMTETITPATDKSTFITRSAMDFSGSDLKAYVATAAAGGNVTMTRVTTVPAATPLVLVGTASTGYAVPIAYSAETIGTNYLMAGDAKTTFDGTTYDYLLYSDGLFYQIGSGNVAAGKAYLHCESDPTAVGEARALSILFDDSETTGIRTMENGQLTKDNVAYDLSGRRVMQPTKGLYIVNGRKVVVK